MTELSESIRRIIVIDDQSTIHDDFRRILIGDNKSRELSDLESKILGTSKEPAKNELTYRIDSAYQGQEGYEKIKKAIEENNPYQLAFVDMRMPPGWDGLETMENILKIDRNIQLVLCTAYSDYSWEDISNRLGVTDNLLILKKPFDVIEIIQIARNLTAKWILSKYARLKMEDLEKRVEERTKTIKEMEKSLYQTSKLIALGEMAGGIAHELNTPLAVIQGSLDMMKSMDTERKFNIYTDLIDHGIESMSKIIDQLRIFCKKGSDKKQIKTNVHDIIDSALNMIKGQLESSRIKLVKEYASDKVFIRCNTSELEQVFLNIILNAKDAMEKTEKKLLLIGTKVNNGIVSIIFQDTGSGIPEEIQERIFEPFFTTKDVGKGSGLGLSISFEIIKKNGGKIKLDTTEKSGTKFVIEMGITENT